MRSRSCPTWPQTWTVSPDATVYTFNLNPAAVWSDGKPVTADDVLWTIAWAAQNPRPRSSRSRSTMCLATSRAARERQGHDEHPRGHQEDRRPHGRDHPRGARLDLPPPPRRRGLLHPAEAHPRTASPPQRRRPARSASGPSARRSAPARTTSPSRSRPPARPSRPRRTTGRARTRRSRSSSTRSRSRTSRSAQLAAGELDLIIRVPPAEGPGPRERAGPQAAERAGRRHLQHQLQQHQHRQGAPPGDRLRDQPAGDHREGPRWPRDAQLHDPARVHGLPDDINKYEFDLDKAKALLASRAGTRARPSAWLLPGRGSELHGHRTGAPAVHPGPRPEGRADRAADRARTRT